MKLLDDLLIVLPDEPNLARRIVLPKWSKGLEGKILAAGPGLLLSNGSRVPMEVEVGDRVCFGAATGMESVFKGQSIRIMRQTDLLGVIEA
jgi:chaperonin GroES